MSLLIKETNRQFINRKTEINKTMFDIQCALIIGVVALALVAMFLGYKAKFDKKGVELEKNDRLHDEKHKRNENRIKTLEEKICELP